MATTGPTTELTAVTLHERVPSPSAERDGPTETQFERLSARLEGTVTILGDIVNPDPDLWV